MHEKQFEILDRLIANAWISFKKTPE